MNLTRKGFTLVELAIVLVVIGLLIVAGSAMLGPLTKQSNYIRSRTLVNTAAAAFQGYTVQNGYAPSAANAAVAFGAVGAPQQDVWGNGLVYNVATALSGSGNGCGVTSTNITVFQCTNTACTTANTEYNIAFIVYSLGPDANGAGTITQPAGGPACPALQTCYWLRQQASPYTVGSVTYYYDDIVQYLSLAQVRQAMGCSQQLSIISSTVLQTGVEDIYYSTQLQATGGIPAYTWSVSGQNMNTLNCMGNSYPLANPNTGQLCLFTSGLLAGIININTLTSTGDLNACSATIGVPNTVTVSDSAFPASGTANYAGGAVTVYPQAMKISTQSLPNAQVSAAYPAIQFNATGGNSTSYMWSVASGALPAGMTLNAGGTLSGTPTVSGTFNFTVQVADSCVPANSTASAFSLNVGCAGINVINSSGGNLLFQRNGGACSAAWANGTFLGVTPLGAGGIQQNDTYLFWTDGACTIKCASTPGLTFSQAQAVDVNNNCQIQFTDANCTTADY